jgi:hypothetical protein
LWAAAGKEQAARRAVHPWEDLIREHLGERKGKIRSTDVWRLIGRHSGQRTQEDNVKLGDAMRKNGWKRTRARDGGRGKVSAYIKGPGLKGEWVELWCSPEGVFSVKANKDDQM